MANLSKVTPTTLVQTCYCEVNRKVYPRIWFSEAEMKKTCGFSVGRTGNGSVDLLHQTITNN